jgi:hypothetical protein
MAESRQGSTWQLEAVPAPSGALVTQPNSVSCSAPDACTLVGTYITGNQQLGLAERWNGFASSQQSVPVPANKQAVDLADVSCPSASACTAVGGAASLTSSAPLAVAWNGLRWKVQPSPAQPGGFLGAVSCAGTASCGAVGVPGLAGSPAALRSGASSLLGRVGAMLPRPGLLADAPTVSALGSAAAAKNGKQARGRGLLFGAPGTPGSSEQLGSSGMYRDQSTFSQLAAAASSPASSLTLAEHWDGTSWTVQTTPGFTGAAVAQAIGISCGSGTLCFATGLYIDNSTGAELPLLEQYNGTKWSIQSIPAPPGALATRLFDVSCSAANACTAVGEAFTATNALAFADRWDGTAWTAQNVAGQAGFGSALGSVSCATATSCTAVGALLNVLTGAELTLAEAWNGSTWTIQPTVDKGGDTSNYLYGVSCNASDACMSVGSYNSNTSFRFGVLTEVWSGTAWRLKPLPAPPNAAFALPRIAGRPPPSCEDRRAMSVAPPMGPADR